MTSTLPQASAWSALVERALAEDLGAAGDRTSDALFPSDLQVRARIEAREELVVCGLEIARAVFAAVDDALQFEARTRDGARCEPGAELARVSGAARSLLAAERSALNFLARLCGIATLTARFVRATEKSGARIVDTRKTLPGWRVLDKYAVATGGGVNHRFGLHDGILIKDNHLAAIGNIAEAVRATRANAPELPVQVEVETLEQGERAIAAGADALLLDNRSPEELRVFVRALGGRGVVLEASGGVTLANVAEVAASGVERISIGALTHSAPGADLALELLPAEGGAT